jgi:hypothetical protein
VPETLDGCLDRSDSVFLVWVAPPVTIAPVLERISTHAGRIVFLSAPLKTAVVRNCSMRNKIEKLRGALARVSFSGG